MRFSIVSVLVLAAGWFVLFEPPAYAYLDINSGYYLVQIIGGLALTVMVTARNKLKWFAGFFNKGAAAKNLSDQRSEQTDKTLTDE
jgi:hypothetical protein